MSNYFLDFSQRKVIGKIEPTVFGSFIEQLGRAVYNGIYEPTHKTSDSVGFRNDVKKLINELGVSIIRFPGGNYVSSHNWKHSIGPIDKRPVDLSLAWTERDPNLVGIDEFVPYAYSCNCEVMMALNLGTGTFEDVIDIVEYCNINNSCYWADERIKNGSRQPYNIKYWCLGNELDGEYQICHMSADDYSKKAVSAAQIAKTIDPNILTIACGSSSPYSAKFPAWDKTVLHETFDYIDFLGIHAYFTYPDLNNRVDAEFFGSAKMFNDYIHTCIKLIKEEKEARKSDKEIYLSVDEWNVWHTFDGTLNYKTPWGCGEPRLENQYDYADMLVFTTLLTTLLNNADYVKIACLAQLINVIAPILTQKNGSVLRQTIFYPFSILANSVKNALSLETLSYLPSFKTKKYGEVSSVYSNVSYIADRDEYVVTLVNLTNEEINLDLICKHNATLDKIITFKTDNIHIKNTFDQPDNVKPLTVDKHLDFSDSLNYVLKPFSLDFLYIKNRKE